MSLARRAGALVAAACVILVAGAAPVLAAAPAEPGPAEAKGVGGGREAARGQETAPGPPTGLGKGPDTTAAGKDAGRPAPAPRSEPAATEPVLDPAPAAKGPADRGSRKPAKQAPAAAPPKQASAAAPAVPAAGPVFGPRAVRPAAGPVPVARPVPVSAPVMGPHVPWTSRPSALATSGSRSDRARVAAAVALPVRPSAAQPQPRELPVDLGTALPTVAAKTAEAVARTPQWPLGIAAVVVLFLLVQNRIDRRDPKLAQARMEDDAPLEFVPAPARPGLRLGHAAA